MSGRNKKILLIIFIIIIVSSALIMSQFGDVSAGYKPKPGLTETAAGPAAGDVVSGKTASEETVSGAVLDESVYWSLAKLLAALVVITAGIYGFLYVLRRMMGNKISGNNGRKIIEVLETTYVAQKKSVSLIRCADRAVLVGIGDSGINVLAELDDEQTAAIMAEYAAEKPSTGFSGIMKDARDKLTGFNIGKLKTVSFDTKKKGPQAA